MQPRHWLDPQAKEELTQQLTGLLSQREEVEFACLHGSFLEPDLPFGDLDVGVWLRPDRVGPESALDYEWELDAWLERHLPYPVEVKVLNYATLGFRYAASGGHLLLARQPEQWYEFRERTWLEYLDFAPISKAVLLDLLRP